MVSMCQRRSGECWSAAIIMLLLHTALNSASAVLRNTSSSFTIDLMFVLLMRAKQSSMARFLMVTSGSLRHSRMVARWRCTAVPSTLTVLRSVFSATYWMFLSLLRRNLPRMLTARTLRPDSESMSMMESTVSYKIALPTFLLVSVLVATWAGVRQGTHQGRTSIAGCRYYKLARQFKKCKSARASNEGCCCFV